MLRCNLMGRKFTVFDNELNPDRATFRTPGGSLQLSSRRPTFWDSKAHGRWLWSLQGRTITASECRSEPVAYAQRLGRVLFCCHSSVLPKRNVKPSIVGKKWEPTTSFLELLFKLPKTFLGESRSVFFTRGSIEGENENKTKWTAEVNAISLSTISIIV
ncbi:hypothetical protein AAFF_G00060350 [Aldrovandia affinis]|uniref:Uncharacterized protein n=1 Tax=Aldrovandia affinis TaxID=143900 RepID=A0AAD7S0I8_9TELE|nr:hypothetical protein AAFF_G00060350 [Aldrovandia affinis]